MESTSYFKNLFRFFPVSLFQLASVRMVLLFSPVVQAELAKKQVHASSKTKVHKLTGLTACLGMFGAHPSTCMVQERMADGDFRTLPAAAWHCIHARFEAGAAAC